MPLRGRVFNRYLFSYLAVALTICLMLGLLLNLVSTRQLSQIELEIYRGRLAQAGDYVERQLAAMEDVRLDIKTNVIFHPFHLKQSPVKAMELVDALGQYGSYSSWVNEYYLWYRNEHRIYSAKGAYDESVFFGRVMGGLDAAALETRFDAADGISFQVCSTRPDALMVCLPFYFGTAKMRTEECALIFMVELNQLRRTIWEITGTERGTPFAIRYDGAPMLGAAEGGYLLSVAGAGGKVELAMSPRSFSGMDRLSSYALATCAVIVAVALVGAALAIYSAWRNYQPIRNLYGKYVAADKAPSNELKTIEELLSSTLQMNDFSQKQLENQMVQLSRQQNWLKQQLVMMLISGNDSPVVQKQIQNMGFATPHSRYAICFLHVAGDGETEGLLRDIEDFSDDEWSLYAAELQGNREYAILINFDEEQQCQEILDLVADMLSARNLVTRFQLSRDVAKLGDIASASIEALNAPTMPLPDTGDGGPDEDDLSRLRALIEAGSASRAQTLLEGIVAQMDKRYPSYLMRIYMLNRLSQQLTAMAWHAGLALSAEGPGGRDPADMRQHLSRLVAALCDAAQQTASPACESDEAAAYVKAHCLDGNISLSSTAEALDISTKQVTRLLRASVGTTFKEYVLRLRMDAAQRILDEGKRSIAETAEQVGYFNISHFIKCFKAYTGMTPGEWRRRITRR